MGKGKHPAGQAEGGACEKKAKKSVCLATGGRQRAGRCSGDDFIKQGLEIERGSRWILLGSVQNEGEGARRRGAL